MKIESGRFGTLDIDERDIIEIPNGLIGFPGLPHYVLLRRTSTSSIGWLQSTTVPELALPVASMESLATEIPLEKLADAVLRTFPDASMDDCSIMAVICALGPTMQATVNLLAPVIVNVKTRSGAQVLLEDSDFTTAEPFRLIARQQLPIGPMMQLQHNSTLTGNPWQQGAGDGCGHCLHRSPP